VSSLRRLIARHPWWVAHAAVVVGLTGAFAALTLATPPEAGANIGAGLIALPLLPLGLPWSLPALVDPYQFDGLGAVAWSVVTFGPAWLNVVLHGAVVAVLRRRRAPRTPPAEPFES
jgi:hypothetical protein